MDADVEDIVDELHWILTVNYHGKILPNARRPNHHEADSKAKNVEKAKVEKFCWLLIHSFWFLSCSRKNHKLERFQDIQRFVEK